MRDESITEVSTNFKRGTTEMLLLALLTKQEWYVYELSKVLKKVSEGLFDIQIPSLYTVLYRLQNKGYVDTRTELQGRRARVYYRILPEGREHLMQVVAEYKSVSRGINAVLEDTVEKDRESENRGCAGSNAG